MFAKFMSDPNQDVAALMAETDALAKAAFAEE
jgi:hypothetical protein